MKTALIISSFVSASLVGATTSAFCLRRLGIESIILPTTLFGRHPGWGLPGGEITPPELLFDMSKGVLAQDIHFDAVLTGYMGHTAHIDLASDLITLLRKKNPELTVLVDPVMGDHGKLYVSHEIAAHLKSQLMPVADYITPNLWEMQFLTDTNANSLGDIGEAALEKLPCPSIITSLPIEDKLKGTQIGAMFTNKKAKPQNVWVKHEKFAKVPNGGGDMIAGLFLAHILNGKTAHDSLARSVATVFDILSMTQKNNIAELPLITHQDAMINAPALKLFKGLSPST